jgi:hypothetical protein
MPSSQDGHGAEIDAGTVSRETPDRFLWDIWDIWDIVLGHCPRDCPRLPIVSLKEEKENNKFCIRGRLRRPLLNSFIFS